MQPSLPALTLQPGQRRPRRMAGSLLRPSRRLMAIWARRFEPGKPASSDSAEEFLLAHVRQAEKYNSREHGRSEIRCHSDFTKSEIAQCRIVQRIRSSVDTNQNVLSR